MDISNVRYAHEEMYSKKTDERELYIKIVAENYDRPSNAVSAEIR
jgi:hypothetical protein